VNKLKRIRILIITASVVGLLSLLSLTITTFAWGNGSSTVYYLVLYPTLMLSTIFVVAKIRFGYVLALAVSICYALLLTPEVGEYLVFKTDNIALFGVLFIPYLTALVLVPLTATFLVFNSNQRLLISKLSIGLSVGFLLYAILDRYDEDYKHNIFIELTIIDNDSVKLICRPGFADIREFQMTTRSKNLIEIAKAQGNLLHNSYLISNAGITTHFKFNKFVSLTIIDLNGEKLDDNLTWECAKLIGDISFLTR